MRTHVTLFVLAFVLLGVRADHGLRVIGGQDALAGQFPFAAAITVQTGNSRFFCGGALARAQWVITAATCVYNATLFTIQLGSTTLTTTDSNRVTVASSEYFVHPDFDPVTLEADIGLIKLRISVTFNDYLNHANFLIDEVKNGTEVVVLGWGQTSDSEAGLSEHLQYLEATALTNEECKLYYGNQIIDSMVCIEGNYNEGTCTGDNGSPLLQRSGPFFLIVGIASFISGNGCESTDPSGYTRYAPYYLWVANTMDEK